MRQAVKFAAFNIHSIGIICYYPKESLENNLRSGELGVINGAN
jgi:hypothetical protein